jgi:hypothetical protein
VKPPLVFDFDVIHDAGSGADHEGGGLNRDKPTGRPPRESRRADVLSIPNEIPSRCAAALAKYGFEFLIPLEPRRRWPRDARLAF